MICKNNYPAKVTTAAAKNTAIAAVGMVLLCIFFLSIQSAQAQYQIVKPAISGKQYPPSVVRVGQDSRGFIWYLTHDGLYRYDGQSSSYFKKELVNLGFTGTPDDMLLDSNDRLWIASKSCVAWLDLKNWKLHKADSALIKSKYADDISSIQQLPNQKVMIVYRSGYLIFGNTAGFTAFDGFYKIVINAGHRFTFDNIIHWKNAYWMGATNGELFQIDTTLKQPAKKITIEKGTAIVAVMPFKDNLICKTINGLIYTYDGHNHKLITDGYLAVRSKKYPWHNKIFPSNYEYLYYNRKSSPKELSLFSDGIFKREVLLNDTAGILTDLYINSFVHTKKNGTVILATSSGIYILFKQRAVIPKLNGKSVRGIYRFPDGDIYYASYSGSRLITKTKTFVFDTVRIAYCMLPLDDHRLLLGYEGGFMEVFDKTKRTHTRFSYTRSKLAGEQFSRFIFTATTRKGKYYLGTGNGVLVLDSASKKLSALIDQQGNQITSKLQIKKLVWIKNKLYLASQRGCFTWSGHSLKKLYPTGTNKGSSVYDMVPGDKGIWIATLNEGLIHLSATGKVIRRLDTDHGLKTNVIFSLLDAAGTLVAGTDRGLVLIKKDSVRLIGNDDGLHQFEFNHGAAFYDRENNIAYMGGLEGYSLLDLNRKWFANAPLKRLYASTITLSSGDPGKSIDIYNLPYLNNLKINLKPKQEYLSISIATPMSYLYKYDLEYRLVGVFDQWQRLEEGQPISLLGLAPGKYPLLVRSGGSIMTGKVLMLFINKEPAFYQTWIFYVILVCIVSGLFYLNYRGRIEKARKESLLRARIASDLHDEVGSVLTGISLQADFLLYSGEDINRKYLKQIGESSREAISMMGDIVWSIDSRNDNTDELLDKMRDYLLSILQTQGIQSEFETNPTYPHIPQLIRQNTYLIFKEAINNISKHASATLVNVSLKYENKLLTLKVRDNGIGFPSSYKARGQGIRNMKMRAGRMKATLTISDPGPGMLIELEVPCC
ncbi:sensor histidine kinase [Pedobacter metabolipauper]|uniref:histidine kinase n=1 Tax=Pedobacter metabolipauper TaxID=425513 RepID=A0A4R6SYN0_9SPHI|nr:histidine kinase [Pedobacter metabolipauper]TDQ11546.1 histidine kinase [Pedobacter metabolipauper]